MSPSAQTAARARKTPPDTPPEVEQPAVVKPEESPTRAHPTVFEAWSATMDSLSPVGKDGWNEQQKFKFRGIDQVMNALAGPMRKHGTMVIPEILSAEYARLIDKNERPWTDVHLTVRFTIYGPAGDKIVGTSQGEARDLGDKATSKAMAMAFKYFCFYAAMIPLDASSIEDGDRHSPDPVEAPRQPAREAQAIANDVVQCTDVERLRELYREASAAKAFGTEIIAHWGNGDEEPVTLKELISYAHSELTRPQAPVVAEVKTEGDML